MMHRAHERVGLVFNVYRCPNGLPTCGAKFGTKGRKVCEFLGTKMFGTIHVCMYDGEQVHRDNEDGTGFIRPHSNCPLWKGKY